MIITTKEQTIFITLFDDNFFFFFIAGFIIADKKIIANHKKWNRTKCDCTGRSDWVRTSDLYVPNVALYQAELHSENFTKQADYATLR